MEEIEDKAKNGREFLASQRAEYSRYTIDIIAQYPISIGKIINLFEKEYIVEKDKTEGKSAKLTIKNKPEND